jgi:hypothetical protein
VNGPGAALSALPVFTVVPRCSPLDLVRLWCGVLCCSAGRGGEGPYHFRYLPVS